jgi:hypothetical protein
MTKIPTLDAIRIIPRDTDFLDRKSGVRGEIFFDRSANTLRLYDGISVGGVNLAKSDLTNVTNAIFSAKAAAAGIGGSGSGDFELTIAGDDSTVRTVTSGNILKFVGSGGISTATTADGEITINGQNSFFWEQLEGPQGTFGKNELLSGTSNEVTFYANYTGKYTLQCTISSPFGTFKKQKTIYIVDGRQLVRAQGGAMKENAISYGKYWDSKNISWVYPPSVTPSYIANENIPLILDKDLVKSNISKINKIAISNYHGVIYPIKTDFSVREFIGSFGSASQDDVYSLSKDYIFSYSANYIHKDTCPLTLIFETNNTIVKLHSVWLEKIRTDQDECSQCLSLYFPKIRSAKFHSKISTSDSNGNIVDTKNYDFNKNY